MLAESPAERAMEYAKCDKAVNPERLSFTLLPFPLGKGPGVRSALGGAHTLAKPKAERAKESATCAQRATPRDSRLKAELRSLRRAHSERSERFKIKSVQSNTLALSPSRGINAALREAL